MVANAFIISSLIGNENMLTQENLIEMSANGWLIGNHSSDAVAFNALTKQQIIENLTTCKNLLSSIGLGYGGDFVAYPQGTYTDISIEAMAEFGAKTGRLSDTRFPTSWEIGLPYHISSNSIHNTTTVAQAKEKIDKVKSTGSVGFINFHDIVDYGASSGKYLTADLEEILDYIESEGIITITFDEYYRLNSNAININANRVT